MNPYDDNEVDLQRLHRDPEGRRREFYYGDRHEPDSFDAPATPAPHEHHELTLSAGAILGLFFGLVVLCGLFFGLGYNMRGHSPAPVVEGASTTPTPATNFSTFKPSPGVAAAGPRTSVTNPTTPSTSVPAPSPVAAPSTPHSADTVPPSPAPVVHPVPGSATPAVPAGAFLVQVAAISPQHKQDADLLLTAMKHKGYAAFARIDSDNLVHVQVGPFATRAVAEEARQRLLADGYSPYIK